LTGSAEGAGDGAADHAGDADAVSLVIVFHENGFEVLVIAQALEEEFGGLGVFGGLSFDGLDGGEGDFVD
jgi:hypothetical protein